MEQDESTTPVTPTTEPTDRRARQRRSIEAALAAGDRGRATALAHEHLLEFPEDEAVKRVLEGR